MEDGSFGRQHETRHQKKEGMTECREMPRDDALGANVKHGNSKSKHPISDETFTWPFNKSIQVFRCLSICLEN